MVFEKSAKNAMKKIKNALKKVKKTPEKVKNTMEKTKKKRGNLKKPAAFAQVLRRAKEARIQPPSHKCYGEPEKSEVEFFLF